MTEPRGTLVLKSTFHGAAPVENVADRRERDHRRRVALRAFRQSIALLRSGKIDPTPLVTRTFPLWMRQQPSRSRKNLE